MSFVSIAYTKKDHIAYIDLTGPDNLPQELEEACAQINQDDDIYVAVISGVEKASRGCAKAVAAINQPAIATISGDAIGEGLELALACDIRLASDKAKFGLPQVSKGAIPMDGGTQRLARVVGKAKALELILTGDTIDAGTALEIGLVHKVVPPEDLNAEAEALARNLAAKAPVALRFAKEAVNKGMDLTLEQGLRLEADMYFILHSTVDRTEGITSFREKRQPEFKGE